MVDPLTGLYNRNSLSEFAHKYFTEASRHHFALSLILIDLDHFKQINDTRGHLVGDIVLEHFGEMLKKNCRGEDFAARYGGEEFLLLLPHCDIEGAMMKAELIRQQAEQLMPDGIPITASIGVTTNPSDQETSMEALISAADKAVYEAKDAGRNRVIKKLLN